MDDDLNPAQRGDHNDLPLAPGPPADGQGVSIIETPLPPLIPVRQEQVIFYGDTLIAVQMADGTVYVPMRPLVETLGLTWPSQSRRINGDRVLGKHARLVQVQTPGGPQDLLALPLRFVAGWLFQVDTGRLRAELQDRIERYQEEAYEVLAAAFLGPLAPPATGLSPSRQALALAEAVAALARQQVDLEERHNTMTGYMRTFVQKTRDHQRQTDARLGALELQVGPDVTISEAQAAEIAGLVSLVADRLKAQAGGTGNFYGTVYTALYQRFGIAKYRNLRQRDFEPACTWLRDWERRMTAEMAPQSPDIS